ncbi:hypothetical protein ACP4OV_020163 [Aristida adscensionis]
MALPGGRGPVACLLLVLLGLLSCLAGARPAPSAGGAAHQPPDGAAWHSFRHLQDARRGGRVAGLAELKWYLARYGYMQPRPDHDDAFDEHMELAVRRYQSRLSLPVTGELDSATLGRITSPRCTLGDGHGHGASVSVSLSEAAAGRFTFYDGEPRWTRPAPMALTYAVSPTATVDYLPPEAVRAALRRAFAHWARVIPVVFVELDASGGDGDGEADIKVGFYGVEHGDGSPFGRDELAHAYGPVDGRVHINKAQRWTVDVDAEKRAHRAIDLETVATHEIGHVLGLRHSSSPEAVMYPYISPGERKVELTADDIEGVQLLYGSNPRFRHEVSVSVSPGRSSWLDGSVSLVCVALALLLTHI